MKKITFMSLLLLAVTSSIIAQPKMEKNIGLYLRGNMEIQTTNYMLVTNEFAGQYNSELYSFTPAIGVKGNFPVSPSLSLSPRISFSQIHNSFSVNKNTEDSSLTSSTQSSFYFLSADLLLNYYLLKGANIKGRIFGGIRADYLINQKKGIDLSDKIHVSYNSIIFNYVGGIGLDLGKRFYTELEYSNNINRLVDNEHMKIKYGAVSINIGYYLF
jgi:hypothetical protein